MLTDAVAAMHHIPEPWGKVLTVVGTTTDILFWGWVITRIIRSRRK